MPKETLLCALSGIFGAEDVQAYRQDGVKGVLVGEALMKAPDTAAFIANLLGDPTNIPIAVAPTKPMVKICGTRTPEAAEAAVTAGASFIGIIRVPGRSRYVDDATTVKIIEAVKKTPKLSVQRIEHPRLGASEYYDHSSRILSEQTRALVVGVYQNAPLSQIIEDVSRLGFDVIQLHGEEPVEYARSIPVPVFRKFSPTEIGISTRGYHALPLLDAGAGGHGQRVDKGEIEALFQRDSSLRVILAGGLQPENITEVLTSLGKYRHNIVAVDVSSGVEMDGKQDIGRIQAFIKAAQA